MTFHSPFKWVTNACTDPSLHWRCIHFTVNMQSLPFSPITVVRLSVSRWCRPSSRSGLGTDLLSTLVTSHLCCVSDLNGGVLVYNWEWQQLGVVVSIRTCDLIIRFKKIRPCFKTCWDWPLRGIDWMFNQGKITVFEHKWKKWLHFLVGNGSLTER